METDKLPKGTISFKLFGIPIYITPFTWLLLALLGGGLDVRDAGDLQPVALFVAIGMLTLLVHELGHALTGRAFAGGDPLIVMQGIGGVTYNPILPEKRWQYFVMVLAGPLASLLLGMLVALGMGAHIGNLSGAFAMYFWYVPFLQEPSAEIWESMSQAGISEISYMAYVTAFCICFWWSVLNLLPVFPLDGGRLLATILNNFVLAAAIGLLLALVLVVWCLVEGMWFNAAISGCLAYYDFTFLLNICREAQE